MTTETIVKEESNLTLEGSIKDVVSRKLADGTFEKLVEEQLEKGITNALKDLFDSYGSVTKVIKEQVKSVMVPYLENYDYSEYIAKLDSVLVDILKNTSLDNKKMLENFKEIMTTEEKKETITVSEIFEAWKKLVAEEVETDGLEIDYDDNPTYEAVEVTLEVEEDDRRSWSSMQNAKIFFECDHDEKLNREISIHRWKDSPILNKEGEWIYNYEGVRDVRSLRHIDTFEIFLMKLSQNGTKLILDTYGDGDSVTPEAEPEASFS